MHHYVVILHLRKIYQGYHLQKLQPTSNINTTRQTRILFYNWTTNYARSEAFQSKYHAVTDSEDEQKRPKGLTEEGSKLYRHRRPLVPQSAVVELCEAWHHHMMHPSVEKQASDMQRRFKIREIGLYNAIKQVKKGCLV